MCPCAAYHAAASGLLAARALPSSRSSPTPFVQTTNPDYLLTLLSAGMSAEAARFGADVQRVVALRMRRLTSGGPLAAIEAQNMVSEKLAAFGEAQGGHHECFGSRKEL